MISKEKKKEIRKNILCMMIVFYIVAVVYTIPFFIDGLVIQGWIWLIIGFSIITGTLVPIYFISLTKYWTSEYVIPSIAFGWSLYLAITMYIKIEKEWMNFLFYTSLLVLILIIFEMGYKPKKGFMFKFILGFVIGAMGALVFMFAGMYRYGDPVPPWESATIRIIIIETIALILCIGSLAAQMELKSKFFSKE